MEGCDERRRTQEEFEIRQLILVSETAQKLIEREKKRLGRAQKCTHSCSVHPLIPCPLEKTRQGCDTQRRTQREGETKGRSKKGGKKGKGFRVPFFLSFSFYISFLYLND